jgi:3-hydroxyacyl-CoA dehydrogenase
MRSGREATDGGRRVVVVGAGHMGHGLAACYAIGGDSVVLVDVDGRALSRALRALHRVVDTLADGGDLAPEAAIAAAARVTTTTDLAAAVRHAALVQETVDERLALKQELFVAIEASAPPDAILGTNTASLRLAEVSARMAAPERLVGLHWFHPPYVVPTVEVVAGEATSPAVVEAAADWLRRIGKEPLLVRDVPGFVVNRLQTALRNTALSLVEQGIADPATIDAAVKYTIGPRLSAFGMFRLYDLIVNMAFSLHTSEYLFASTGEERYRPSPLMRERVAAGATGLGAGRGWYDYRELDRAAVEAVRDRVIAATYRAQRELDSPSILDDAPVLDLASVDEAES